MAELADAPDSKSGGGNIVSVQVRSPALYLVKNEGRCLHFFVFKIRVYDIAEWLLGEIFPKVDIFAIMSITDERIREIEGGEEDEASKY